MMLYTHGTGALLVLILMGIALLMAVLIGIGWLTGSLKPKQACLWIGLVIAGLASALIYHGLNGGEFPRLIRTTGSHRILVPVRIPGR